jgi:hypothetical protein
MLVVFRDLKVQWILWLCFYLHATVVGVWLTVRIFIRNKSLDDDYIDVKKMVKASKVDIG